jgi:hypothetical protein
MREQLELQLTSKNLLMDCNRGFGGGKGPPPNKTSAVCKGGDREKCIYQRLACSGEGGVFLSSM